MTGNGKRWLAAATVLAFAALFVGFGVRFSTADEPKVADLADLRDAVKSASKRGDNVDEIAKALAGVEKLFAGGFKTPADKANPPAELAALRAAVENAARKGENVDEIRKQLDAVEMKLLGRVLEAPKPATPPLGDGPPPRPEAPFRRLPNDFPVPRFEFPAFPQGGFGGKIDREALQKSMDLRREAMELLIKDPNDPKALELAQQATEQMLKAIAGGANGGLIDPEMFLQELGGAGRERFRLGIRMEKPSPVVAEQLGLEAGRGIVVAEVIAGSAAEKAGFKANDIIVEFAGKPVSDQPEEFNKLVTAAKAGEKITAVVLRKGKKVELKGIELPAAEKEAPRLNRRFPQPRFEVKPFNFPDLPNLGALPEGGGGLSVTLNNGNFTIKSQQDGVKYTLKGTTEDGAAKLSEAVIEANGKETKADSLEKVPAEYRPTVEKLLKTIGGSGKEVRLRPKPKVKD